MKWKTYQISLEWKNKNNVMRILYFDIYNTITRVSVTARINIAINKIHEEIKLSMYNSIIYMIEI